MRFDQALVSDVLRDADVVANRGGVTELDPKGLKAGNLCARQDEFAIMAQAGRRFVEREFGESRGSRGESVVGVVGGLGVGNQFVEITEGCDVTLQQAHGCPAVLELLGDVGRAKAFE